MDEERIASYAENREKMKPAKISANLQVAIDKIEEALRLKNEEEKEEEEKEEEEEEEEKEEKEEKDKEEEVAAEEDRKRESQQVKDWRR